MRFMWRFGGSAPRISKIYQKHRDFAVNMSSESISRRLRVAGELNELGISLSKAKPCPPPYEIQIPIETVPAKRNAATDPR